MTINRGYKANHKPSGLVDEIPMAKPISTMIGCPNCGAENYSIGRYDEGIDTLITCSGCRFTTSKWNYDFISSDGYELNIEE